MLAVLWFSAFYMAQLMYIYSYFGYNKKLTFRLLYKFNIS